MGLVIAIDDNDNDGDNVGDNDGVNDGDNDGVHDGDGAILVTEPKK